MDYQNILDDWIYPKLNGIRIAWTPSKDDHTKGLVHIFIPNQPGTLRPFLIKKDIDPTTNQKRKEILFGYAERLSHSSKPATIETLHTMLRLGRENQRFQNLEGRVAIIETLLSQRSEETERKKNLELIVSKRIDQAVDAANLRSIPHYSITTTPMESTEVESLLSSTDDSITRLLENPPKLRYAGWAMETEDRARLVGGELRRVKVEQYKLLDLYRDGTLVFVCTADESLLGWGNTFGRGRINPLALIEITYMYFDFYSKVINRFASPVRSLQVEVRLENLLSKETKFSLAPHGVGAMSQRIPHYLHAAPETRFSFRRKLDLDTFDAAKAAYQVIREIYAWFGIEEDRIPYLTRERNAVSVDRLKDPKSEDN